MTAKELFTSGDLPGAVSAAVAEVKQHPSDNARRTFLFELLCFMGDLDRAQKQLDAIGQLDSQSDWAVQVYTNILHAERRRRQFFADGLKPEFLLDPPPYVQLSLDAVNRLREGRADDAQGLLSRSEEARPTIAGVVNGQVADELRDCDDVLAAFVELFVIRDYVWLPLEQVRELETSPPERPRDLLWLPVRLTLSDGVQQRGYLPTLYCGSHEHADNRVKLGRMTDWSDGAGPVRGSGLHTWLAGDDALGLLDVRNAQLKA
ncbi:MAG TPA: type VI secretion system accessory protein TagJ [Pirellulales bacterium]|nr:type VI secretion system accessory protein TagJ [Pirellulales bacterium]